MLRVNPKIAGTTHNVLGIQTGVSIMFLVKKFNKEKKKICTILYSKMEDEWRKEVKLQWLSENPLAQIDFTHIQHDKNNNWLNIAETDFDSLIPLVDKIVKAGNSKKALFELFSLGVVTNRDHGFMIWTTKF